MTVWSELLKRFSESVSGPTKLRHQSSDLVASVWLPALNYTPFPSSFSLSSAGKYLACEYTPGDYSKLHPCAFVLAFSRLLSCLSQSQRQSKCNLVEGMTMLPTVAAIAAGPAPRLCPKAFYVILKGMCLMWLF